MYYSKTTKSFYIPEIDIISIPSDAVEVSDEAYRLLIIQQADGKQIVPNNDGYPIAITAPVIIPTWEQIKAQRNELLRQCDWTVLPDSPVSNQSDWLTYRQALRDIPQDFATPEEVVWPTLPV